MRPLGHPILSCAAAGELEARILAGDESREWDAMTRAGAAIAREIARDSAEIGGLPRAARLLVLAGKGHNGGDALLAAECLLRAIPDSTADVVFALGDRDLRPLAARAMRQLAHYARDRIRVQANGGPILCHNCDIKRGHDVCLDGVFGFQFRPPLPKPVKRLFAEVERMTVRLRAAVDLPSGMVFRADFTYATGSVKAPLVDEANAAVVGRLRYLDLGFFDGESESPAESGPRVLLPSILDPLRALRDPRADKRTHGNLFVVAGSNSYPGAALMTVLGALRSGVGLVTAFVPERVAPAFAARAPGAIWVPCPVNSAGGLAPETAELLGARISRATAIAIGPGMGDDRETLALARSIVAGAKVPLVIDADALRPEITGAGRAPRVLTPHAGELKRLGAGTDRRAGDPKAILVEKGQLTRIRSGSVDLISPFGGPVLARGGSGDILAGILGGLAAQGSDLLLAAAQGVVWHGISADFLARTRGQRAVETTDLLEFMGAAMRGEAEIDGLFLNFTSGQ